MDFSNTKYRISTKTFALVFLSILIPLMAP